MQNSKQIYKLKDFYTSAILRASGFPLLGVEKAGSISTFLFAISPTVARTVIDQYWNKDLLIDARTLIEAINELKTRIHSA